MSEIQNPRLRYWNESLLEGHLPSKRKSRYIVFDVDQGGLNNIRLVFEYVAVLAVVTGRTLVLPPRSAWYLLNYGPMPEKHKGGTTGFDDLFDLAALKKVISVIDTHEFIETAESHLQIPEIFSNQQSWAESLLETTQEWREWLLDHCEIPAWNPHDTVICWPDIELAEDGPHLHGDYLADRKPVEFSAWALSAPVIYFPSNADYRSLGPVATMLASFDDSLPTLTRRFIKHHLRFHRDIFSTAERILDALNLEAFDALQVRRNDFQYAETQTSSQKICDNVKVLFDKQLPIYIATDEERDEIFEQLAAGFNSPRIICWADVEAVYDEPIPFAWIGILEQLICVAARRFVGTDLSTFTAYINRLRGYVLAPDQSIYFHSNCYAELPNPTLASDFSGRDYLRENPLFWLAC